MKQYFCDITNISEKELTRWYHQMQPPRQEKCRRLKKEEVQKQCIAADHLVRTALSEQLNKPVSEIEILISPSGKPYIKGNPLYFSLSHSETMVACAVADLPIGIDIERIRPVLPEVQRRICTPDEWKYLSSAKNETERTLRFFYLWTRKEAIFKIDGCLPRRDKETDVLTLPAGISIDTRTRDNYTISVAKQQKL